MSGFSEQAPRRGACFLLSIGIAPEMSENLRMGELTTRVLGKLQAAESFDEIKDWIWMAGDLIRKASSPGFHSGFEEIDREQVSVAERTELREAALSALSRSSDPNYVTSLLNVLRCTGDNDLLPLYVEYLAKYLQLLKTSNIVVFSILLALGDIREPVFEGTTSRCVLDIERNVKEAFEFLRKRGIVVPG
jgi:hypothetical protein